MVLLEVTWEGCGTKLLFSAMFRLSVGLELDPPFFSPSCFTVSRKALMGD